MPAPHHWEEKLLVALPYPLSRLAYAAARRVLRKDRRRQYFKQAFRHLAENKIEGDYLEFGVYRGSSFVTAYQLSRQHRLNAMRFFAFDSFCGLPSDDEGKWTAGAHSCSRQRFLKIISQAGVDLGRVHAIEGYYSDSLNPVTKAACGIRQVAMVHLDCDLRSSTAEALEFVAEYIVPGTVLVFDDWVWRDGSGVYGQRRAFVDWPISDCFEPFYEAGKAMGFVCRRAPATLGREPATRAA